MIALIQRVSAARVEVDGETTGAIEAGLLALVAVQPGDGESQIERLLGRLLGYRVFADAEGRMNRSLADTGGGLRFETPTQSFSLVYGRSLRDGTAVLMGYVERKLW